VAFQTIVIAGVGLIGGSFALAMKRAGYTGRILGVSSENTLRHAKEQGVIDEGMSLEQAVPQADLVYLAQPIGRIIDQLHHLDGLLKPGALVTDAGSTKSAICAAARQFVHRAQFLGGHPMAGKETRGVGEAEGGLFEGRTYVLTPASEAEMQTPAAAEFAEWIERIGARLVIIGPDEHDRVVSFTSHLPQILSSALSATVASNLESDEQLAISGPGLVDMTRLARSSWELWRDILATNAGSVDQAIEACISRLEHMRENLKSRQLREEFEQAAALANRLRRSGD
jgi:prephenate dehydrogenase